MDPNGFAKGIWVFWDDSEWKVDVISYSNQVVHMKMNDGRGSSWFFSACYGRPQRVLRD